MFISFLYMFGATMCPSSGKKTVFMGHLVPDIPDSRPHRITRTKCRINTVVSPDDGHVVAPNMYRKEINILRKIVHQVGFIYKSLRIFDSIRYRRPAPPPPHPPTPVLGPNGVQTQEICLHNNIQTTRLSSTS